MDRIFRQAFHYPQITESAGTAIFRLVAPKRNYITRLTDLLYRAQGTAHTVVVMKPVGSTVTTAAAASGQADIVVSDASPYGSEALASGDYLAFEDASDAGFAYGAVSSVSSTTVTLGANLAANVASGAKVWAFYEIARSVHFRQLAAASGTLALNSPISGLFETDNRYEPLLVYSANGTAAGYLNLVGGYYAKL